LGDGGTADLLHYLKSMLPGSTQNIDELPVAAKMLEKMPLDLL
jgi:hypothetical protein